MQSATKMRTSSIIAATLTALAMSGCSKEETPTAAPPASSSAAAAPAASTAPPPTAAPPASSVAAPVVKHDCPKGSTGEGSYNKPCLSKGATRFMEVAWTGKIDEKGPHFRVTNKSPLVIVYGKLAVYFYDKAGKQLEAKDDTETPPKPQPFKTCAGNNLFSGVMKPGEKAVLTFSCVQKKDVPEGTTAIEGEMQMVGFSDPTEKKVDFYWSNPDLVPEARKKGGVK
jgi:hypothetical protein